MTVSPTDDTLETVSNTQIVLESTEALAASASRTIELILHVNPAGPPRIAASITYANEAEVTASGDWSGKVDIKDDANASIDVSFEPEISLTKTADDSDLSEPPAPGDEILYTFTVTNTGNTPLIDVTLDDPLPDLVWDSTGPIAQLDPGASDSTTFTAHYVLTQDDIEAGVVDNTATASGRWADDSVPDPIVSDSDSATVDALAEPSLTLAKAEVSNTVQDPTLPGDTIRYSFTVINTGNVDLRDVVLVDALPVAADPAGSFIIGTLARAGEDGDRVIVYADYAVTQDDIDAGEVVNTATVSGTHGPDGTPVNAGSNEVTTPLYQERSMVVTKLPDTPLPTAPRAGEAITWTITIENTGNTRLEVGAIAEPLADTTVSAPAQPVLQPGESTTATATHTLTQTEIDAGEVINQVTVSGKVPGSDIPFDDTPSGNDPDTPNED